MSGEPLVFREPAFKLREHCFNLLKGRGNPVEVDPPSFGPKSGVAKVEPAGSVLVVVVTCSQGCRPGLEPVTALRRCVETGSRSPSAPRAAGSERSGESGGVEHTGTRRPDGWRAHVAVDLGVES